MDPHSIFSQPWQWKVCASCNTLSTTGFGRHQKGLGRCNCSQGAQMTCMGQRILLMDKILHWLICWTSHLQPCQVVQNICYCVRHQWKAIFSYKELSNFGGESRNGISTNPQRFFCTLGSMDLVRPTPKVKWLCVSRTEMHMTSAPLQGQS